MRLCKSSGKYWQYHRISELAIVVMGPLVGHYESWLNGFQDIVTHALFLAVSGPGTGKSRMLDEIKSLVCEAAKRSKKQDLVERQENAYVFNVTFGGDTPATEKLDFEYAEFDVSYRTLYQLEKERQSWPAFSFKLKHSCKILPLSIGMMVNMLAKLEKIGNAKDMTVILCVDGLENLSSDGTKTCDLYCVLTSTCSFLNSSTAFAVCVGSTTDQKHVDQSLLDSSQRRMLLHSPAIRGKELLKPRTRFEKQLVDDMDGIGGALEVLHEVLQRHHKDSSEEVDPVAIVDDVYDALKRQYLEAFTARLFDDPSTCQEILAAILSRRSYGVNEYITSTNVAVCELKTLGLFRWTPDRRLECASILLVKLIRKISKRVGESEICELGWER